MGSTKIASEENCPPALILTLITNQTLTLTGGGGGGGGGAIFRTPFWCLKELKMWISDALFEQKRFSFDNLTHVVFWTKSELFYKNQLEVSPQITISESTKCGREKPIHAIHAKTTSNSRRNNKNLNTLSLQLPTKCTPFYN